MRPLAIAVFGALVAVADASGQPKQIPSPDSGGLAIAAVNRMIMAAVKGVQERKSTR